MKYTDDKDDDTPEETPTSRSLLTIARLVAWVKSWTHVRPKNEEKEEQERDGRPD